MAMHTPVLFLIFNRPDATKRVFEEIRKARPSYLFIAADGPREHAPEDAEKCRQARTIAARVDWPCEVTTLFREKNVGCKIAVSSAIDWFFEHVEEGIILEDDCLPDVSFFKFCAELLQTYRDHEKIMMIGGSNFAGSRDYPYSYFFSHYARLWGWATWKRAWKKYDVRITSWADDGNKKTVRQAIGNRRHWKEKEWVYNQLYLEKKDTWDYQWEYTMLVNRGLSAVPKNNLIENIGFGENATHTLKPNKAMTIERKTMIFPLSHNPNIAADADYDKRFIPKRSLLKRLSVKFFGRR